MFTKLLGEKRNLIRDRMTRDSIKHPLTPCRFLTTFLLELARSHYFRTKLHRVMPFLSLVRSRARARARVAACAPFASSIPFLPFNQPMLIRADYMPAEGDFRPLAMAQGAIRGCLFPFRNRFSLPLRERAERNVMQAAISSCVTLISLLPFDSVCK